MDRLKGKVALITGAGCVGNIGLAICEAFFAGGRQRAYRHGCEVFYSLIANESRIKARQAGNDRNSFRYGGLRLTAKF